jgi:hypothetical protein
MPVNVAACSSGRRVNGVLGQRDFPHESRASWHEEIDWTKRPRWEDPSWPQSVNVTLSLAPCVGKFLHHWQIHS